MESTGSVNSVLIKRKRSKRQRPSPFCAVAPAAITSSSSSGGDDCGSRSNRFSIDHSSPSISTDLSEITEVEEEVADCLMMLAKSICPSDELGKVGERSTDNFCNRRFSEMAAAGKDGYDVYECKTCYRTFHSFQALGGHRTSHNKKQKLAPEENTERRLAMLPPLDNAHDEGEEESLIHTNFILAPLPLLMITGKGKAKLHQCSICGTEFLSGQALGGHMRRHRTSTALPPPPAMNPTTCSPTITNFDSTGDVVVENRSKRLLFDLNFPALKADHREFNSELASTSGKFVLPALDWFNC